MPAGSRVEIYALSKRVMYCVHKYVHGILRGTQILSTSPDVDRILETCDGFMSRDLETGAMEIHLKMSYEGHLNIKRFNRNYHALVKPLEKHRVEAVGSSGAGARLRQSYRFVQGPGAGPVLVFSVH